MSKTKREEENRKPDTRIVMMPLEVKLTEAELKTASKALAEALRAKAAKEGEMETFKAQKKAEITQYEGVIAAKTVLINSEKEYRTVECEETFHWATGKKTVTRLDTGEIVRSEPINNSERQLFLGADPAIAA